MKILAISGSPREKNTHYMIKKVLEKVEDQAEIIKLSDLQIKPCTSCRVCTKAPFDCIQTDDMKRLSIKLRLAEVIILASPVYFDNVTGTMKNFFDRCLGLYWSKKLEGKKVVLLSVASGERESSPERCLDSMSYWAELMKMDIIAKVGVIKNETKSKDEELGKISEKILEELQGYK